MADVSVIADLLTRLAEDNKISDWKIKCGYSDGLDKSYHEIHFCLNPSRAKKIIIFQTETEKVLPYSCKGLPQSESENIIDLLLDLMNEKRSLS